MSDTMTVDVAESTVDVDEIEEPLLEPLIEEISIDGMCGVY
jgi:mycofactocin precursor